MAPLPPVANVLKARILFRIGSKPTQGVRQFYRWSGTAPTSATLNTLAQDLYNAIVTAGFATVASTKVKLTGTELIDLTSAMGATGSYEATTTGARAGVALPAADCFVSSYEITRRYRGGHPRSYWPLGTDLDETGPQLFKSASVTAFTTFVEDINTGFVGTSVGGTTVGNHVAIAYYEGFTAVMNPLTGRYRNVPKLRTTPLVTNVTSIIGRNYIGSFRRRRVKT